MASNTKQTRFRRARRNTRMGQDRKKALEKNGTTPAFPIHTAESHKNAPEDQLPQSDG